MPFGGSLGLPFPPSRVLGAPSRAPVGLASACPVRRCVVGRGSRVLSVPTPSLVSCSRFVSLAGPRRTPSPVPRRLSGGGGWRGDRAAVSSFRKRSYDS